MTERIAPPYVAGEREMLTSWLDWHRETLARKCAGLPEERLRERAAEADGTSAASAKLLPP